MSATSFPDDFEWGTATAAHQIEGGNWNNDWWAWEHAEGTPCVAPSGDACDSWNRWEADVAVVAELGFDTYRFSVEWSRIEPEPGELSVAALDHYLRQAEALATHGVGSVVSFHHFTTPRWVVERGGWTDPATADRFADFCSRVATHLGPLLHRACTINEPNVVAHMGYGMGLFPPGRSDPAAVGAATETFVTAHRGAVHAIRAAAPGVPVGLTLSMTDYQAVEGGEAGVASARASEDVYLDATTGDDFVGVQTYSRRRIGPDGWLGPEEGVPEVPTMFYEEYPEALTATIRRAWHRTAGSVPILVTENGLAAEDDTRRIAFVRRALEGVLECLADGIDVRGYTYWSLLDNFEWAFGYVPRFGLVEVDQRFARTPKPSARWLAEVMATGSLA